MTTFTGIFCGVIGLVGIIKAIENYRERKTEMEMYDSEISNSTEMNTEENSVNSANPNEATANTSDIMHDALVAIGCQPRKDNEGHMFVDYQGEHFSMEFGGPYVRVWDAHWSGVKADDPMLPNLREAMNNTNFNFGPTIVMDNPDDNGVISFHSRRDIMLHPTFPDAPGYVKAVLDSFFTAQNAMRQQVHGIIAKQAEKQKNRRPVGFTTTQTPQTEEK